jgi:anti-sigma factor RsiW
MNFKVMNQEQIERYVRGRMSEPDAQAFEEYCVANPDFARQVEFEQRLVAGITQVSRGNTAEFVRSNNQALRWQVAAGVAFMLLAGFLAWRQFSPRIAPAIMAQVTRETPSGGPSLRLAMVRGNESTPALPRGRVRVAIAGLFDPGFHYSIALDRVDQKRNIDTIATLNGQSPTSPDTLEVFVDSDQLDAGAYSLRIRKQASSDEALDFEFLKN